jgi:hypothetical protein
MQQLKLDCVAAQDTTTKSNSSAPQRRTRADFLRYELKQQLTVDLQFRIVPACAAVALRIPII